MNIEQTIYDKPLPPNTIPVLDRLKELLKESNTNSIRDINNHIEIRECMWLLNHQFDCRSDFIEWCNLKEVRDKLGYETKGITVKEYYGSGKDDS